MTSTERMSRPTFWQYAWQLVGFGAIYVILTFVAAAIGFSHLRAQLLIAVVAAVVMAVGLLVGYGAAARIGEARLESLREIAPGAFVFRFSSSLGFGNLFAEPGTKTPIQSSVREGFGASATTEGVTVWFGTPPRRVTSIGWKSVIGVELGKVTSGQLNYPSATVSCLADDGSTRALQLVKANAEALPVRSRVEVDWVVSELNALRSN